ncbi:hypothetical protein HZA75_02545 [Candidatus Roizmanbacteria bacterium]|nr:hypothetical protein [Candidatus Roizmanbacteria bacterium]
MIEAGRIGPGREYKVVRGAYDQSREYDAVVLHFHTHGDTANRRRMLRAARKKGIGVVGITDHDSTTQLRKARRGRNFPTIINGVEVTASNGEHVVHVTVYGNNIESPPGRPGEFSPQQVNSWAHEQGAVTAVPHPGMSVISITPDELAIVQNDPDPTNRFDFGEIVNGSALRYDAWIEEHPRFYRLIERFLPQAPGPNENEKAEKILNEYVDELPFFGASDAHDRRGVATVINLVPKGQDPLEAIRRRDVVILQKNVIDPLRTLPFVWGILKGELFTHGASKLPKKMRRHIS